MANQISSEKLAFLRELSALVRNKSPCLCTHRNFRSLCVASRFSFLKHFVVNFETFQPTPLALVVVFSVGRKFYTSQKAQSSQLTLKFAPLGRLRFIVSQISCRNVSKIGIKIVGSLFLDSDVIEVEGPAFAESISEGDIRWLKSGWKKRKKKIGF